MAIPFTDRKTVFDSISATATVELHNLFRGGHFGSTILLEVFGASSQDWTLDIQGKVTEDGTYTNMDYQRIWQAGTAALSKSQLTVDYTTPQFYAVPNAPQFVQLVATRTAGNLTVLASMTSEPFNPALPLGGRADVSRTGEGTVSDGDRVNAQFDIRGRLGTFIGQHSESGSAVANVDTWANFGENTSQVALVTASALYGYNGAAHDRLRTIGASDGAGRGVLSVGARSQGASEVKTVHATITNSTTKVDIVDPTSGKKIRMISVQILCGGASPGIAEVYFGASGGSGANLAAVDGKEIAHVRFDDSLTSIFHSWPDGAGPVGAADDFLVYRLGGAEDQAVHILAVYREE